MPERDLNPFLETTPENSSSAAASELIALTADVIPEKGRPSLLSKEELFSSKIGSREDITTQFDSRQARKKSSVLHNENFPCVAEGLQATLSYTNIADINGRTSFDSKSIETRRSWLILTVAFFAQAFTFGIGYSSGIFSAIFVEYFSITSAQASLVFALVNGVANLSGPVASALANAIGHRASFCFGTILAVVGFACTFYCQSIWQLYVAYGCVVGVSFGTIRVTSIGAIGHSFDRNRNLAASIAFGGASVGCITLPVIISVCNGAIGWRYTMLLFAIASAALGFCGALSITECAKTPIRQSSLKIKKHKFNALDTNEAGQPVLTYYAERRASFSPNPVELPSTSMNDAKQHRSFKTIFDTDLLCRRKFCILLIFNFFASGFLIYHMVTVEHAQTSGKMSSARAPYLISIVGIGDVIGKAVVIFSLLFMSYVKAKNRKDSGQPSAFAWACCMALCSVLTAITLVLAAYTVSDFVWAAAIALLFGSSFGVVWSCYPSLVMESFGSERLTACQGYANFVCGVAQIAFLYVGAQIIEKFGSFILAYWFGASCLLVSAAALWAYPT